MAGTLPGEGKMKFCGVDSIVGAGRRLSFAVLLISMVQAVPAAVNDRAHLAYGMEYEDTGNVAAAIIEFKNALKINPDNLQARWRLGRALLRSGDTLEAEKNLSEALKKGVARELLIVDLGTALLLNQEYARLLETLTSSDGRGNSERARVLTLRGMAQLYLHELDVAGKSLLAALELQPDSSGALVGLAQLAATSGNPQQMKAVLARGRDSRSDDPFVWVLMGRLNYQLGQFEQAVAQFQKALELEPGNSAALLGMASARLAQGRFQDSRPWVEQLLAVQPASVDGNLIMARIALSESRLEVAEKHLALLLRASPKNVQGLLLLASVSYDLGQNERALALIRKFLGSYSEYLPARKLLALIQLRLDAADEALWGLESLLAIHPDDAQLLALLIKAAILAGKTAQARMHAGLAVTLPWPDSIRTQFAAINEFLITDASVQHALPILDKLVDGYRSEHRRQQIAAALLQLDRQDWPAIDDNIRSLLLADPGDTGVHLLHGLTQYRRGDSAAARASIENALQIDAENVQALNALAILELRADDVDAATTAFGRSLSIDPVNADALMGMAGIASLKGDSRGMNAWLERMRAAHRAASAPRFALAWSYLDVGDTQRAAAVIAELAHLVPNDPRLPGLQGALATVNGDLDAALVKLTAAVELRPASARSWYRLAWVRSQLGMPDTAMLAYQRSLDLQPDDIDTAAQLLRLQLAAGDTTGALALIEALQPYHPVAARIMRGDVFLAAAQRDEALVAWLGALGQVLGMDVDHRQAVVDQLLPRFDSVIETEQQLATVRQALQRAAPTGSAADDLAGRFLLRTGDVPGAVALYRRLHGGDSESSLWTLRLATAQQAAGYHGDARATLAQWLLDHPADLQANLLLGGMLLAAQQLPEAYQRFQRVLELSPDNAIALNNVAWLGRGENTVRSLAYARRAVELEPLVSHLHTLGVLLIESGEFQEAVTVLQRAARSEPENREVKFQLARALVGAGSPDEARRMLQQVLDSGQEFESRAAAQQLFDDIGGG